MFEKFLRKDAADFRTRYHGTYGFYRNLDKDQRFLCRLEVIEDHVFFKDKRGVNYELKADATENIGFEFLPPKSGFFNTPAGALYVERQATRQFQRGINDKNTVVYRLDPAAGGWHRMGVNFQTLESLYENKMDRKLAYTAFVMNLSPSFSIGPQFAVDKKTLWVLATKAGTVVEAKADKLKLKLNDPDLFRTEITDAMRGFIDVEFQ